MFSKHKLNLQTLARHVRLGETFNLTCSVIVDFHVMVELTWTIPNQAAIKENRVTVPEIVSDEFYF